MTLRAARPVGPPPMTQIRFLVVRSSASRSASMVESGRDKVRLLFDAV